MIQLRKRRLSLVLLGALAIVESGAADAWQNAVTGRLSTQFDSNPTMTPFGAESVWRSVLEPRYSLVGNLGEGELNAGLAFQLERSSNQTLSPDRNSPSTFFDWIRQSEAGEVLGVSARYAEIATRDAGIAATGSTGSVGTRASRSLIGKWSAALTERSMLLVDGTYEGVVFRGGAYTDYSTQTGGLRYNYKLSENASPFLGVLFDKYVPMDTHQSVHLSSSYIGVNGKTELMDWNIQIGRAKDSLGSANWLASIGGGYSGQLNRFYLNAENLILPSGQGGFAKVNNRRGGWRHELSEYSSSGIDLEGTKTITGSASLFSTTVSAWFEHDLSLFWKMRMNYMRRIYNGSTSGNAYSNIIGIDFSYVNLDY